MLDYELRACIGTINYSAMFGKTVDEKIERVLYEVIYEPLSRESPQKFVSWIREALASGEKLNEFAMRTDLLQSEEDHREFLTKLIERIEFYEANGRPLSEDIGRMNYGDSMERLRILLQPLGETSTLSDAVKRFEEKVLPSLKDDYLGLNTRGVIAKLLRFNTDKPEIHSLITRQVTDAILREYLRKIGWMVEEFHRKR